MDYDTHPPLDPAKFRDPSVTARGEVRATVTLGRLRTLWFNTGSLCNITCAGCYIESSPSNDRLAYLTPTDAAAFLGEADPDVEIGFTGGEPFLNPHIIDLLDMTLSLGHRALVLTNAMQPMMRPRVRAGLKALGAERGVALTLRVSLDHPDEARHDAERGPGAFRETIVGLDWLFAAGFTVAIAGRLWGEDEMALRARFAEFFSVRGWPVDAMDHAQLVLFPEMDDKADVPEITTACWDRLGRKPQDVMCASSRMVVRRKGAAHAAVVPCTLLPYDPRFELGASLAGSAREVALNHPHCARFCVLGGGKCAT